MFGTRGAVGGAAASFHLRRAHAGAETREELEALPDRVLDAVVAEARELDDRRAAETLDRRNEILAANPNEADDPEGGGLPAPNPTAEAALISARRRRTRTPPRRAWRATAPSARSAAAPTSRAISSPRALGGGTARSGGGA